MIDDDEFGAVAAGSGLYEGSGGGDGLTRDELGAGLYDVADYDGDDAVGSDEHGWFDWF